MLLENRYFILCRARTKLMFILYFIVDCPLSPLLVSFSFVILSFSFLSVTDNEEILGSDPHAP